MLLKQPNVHHRTEAPLLVLLKDVQILSFIQWVRQVWLPGLSFQPSGSAKAGRLCKAPSTHLLLAVCLSETP